MRIKLLLIFVLTFSVRIFFIYAVRIPSLSNFLPNPGYASDFIWTYDRIAQNILAGNGFTLFAGYPLDKIVPLYPLFLSSIYSLFGNTKLVVHPVLAIIDGFSALIIYFITAKLFGRKVAIISSLAFAFYPPFIYLTSTASSEVIYFPLHLLFTYFLIDFFSRYSFKKTILCGIFWGLSGLCRPVAIGLPVFILLGTFVFYYQNFTLKVFKQLTVLFSAMLITVLPWSIRNYFIFNKFYLLNSSFARISTNLYFGSLEEQIRPDPNNERSKMFWEHVQAELSNSEDKRPINEVTERGSEVLLKSYLKNIKENPFRYAKFILSKSLRFWYATDSGKLELLLAILQGMVVLLGIVGLGFYFYLDYWRKIFPLLLIILYYPLLSILTLPLARYSMPVMPFVIMLAIYGILNLGRLKARKRKHNVE